MDIKVLSLRDAGTPKERLLIRVLHDCNLKGYMVVDNTYDDNGRVSNVNRHVFIFPDCEVTAGNIVRLYTGKGRNRIFDANYGRDIVTYYNFYWGFDEETTVWNLNGDMPYLVHYDEVTPDTLV